MVQEYTYEPFSKLLRILLIDLTSENASSMAALMSLGFFGLTIEDVSKFKQEGVFIS